MLDVAIVNLNTADLLAGCLKYLNKSLKYANMSGKANVFVVDNASTDQSVELVRKNFPQVNLIVNKSNPGFAKANNQVLIKSEAKYVLLLNSDTKLQENCLIRLIEKMEKDPSIGAIGPKLLNSDSSLQPSGGFYPNLYRVFLWMFFIDDLPFFERLFTSYHPHSSHFFRFERDTDWVSGACLLVRMGAVKKAGLLDENIFMYAEEVEWCNRIKNAGFRMLFYPNASCFHLKGGSSEGVYAGLYEEFKSLVYIYQKNHPRQIGILTLFLRCGALLRLILFGIIRRHKDKVKLYAKAFQAFR